MEHRFSPMPPCLSHHGWVVMKPKTDRAKVAKIGSQLFATFTTFASFIAGLATFELSDSWSSSASSEVLSRGEHRHLIGVERLLE